MANVRHFYRVLERDVKIHQSTGWSDDGMRDVIPSLPKDPVCLLEWNGEGEPRLPEKTGRKDDEQKIRYSLLPRGTIAEVAAVLTDGGRRYGDDNWQRVPNARQRYYDALMRHLDAYWNGEDIDPQSGRSHLAHAAANCLFLLWMQRNSKQE